MTKMADEEFATTGFTSSYAFLLMTVNKKPGIQPTEIAREMMLTPSTVTRLIEKMELKKYVTRESEGKITRVYPADKSKKIDKKLREAWLNVYGRYSEILGKDFSHKVTGNINEIITKLEK